MNEMFLPRELSMSQKTNEDGGGLFETTSTGSYKNWLVKPDNAPQINIGSPVLIIDDAKSDSVGAGAASEYLLQYWGDANVETPRNELSFTLQPDVCSSPLQPTEKPTLNPETHIPIPA